MSVQTDKLPPVPQHDPPVDSNSQQGLLSPNWMRWFLQVKYKVDSINASLVALSALITGGFAVLTATGTWASRTITGVAGKINVSNGDGVAGNPSITIADTAVTVGSYTNASLTVGSDGRLTAAASGVVTDSGTYTPTLTPVSNVAATSAPGAQYLRVGNTVTVGGRMIVDPTSVGVLTEIGISLPIPSNFTSSDQCGGVGASGGVSGQTGQILADVTNDRAQFIMTPADAANRTIAFTFTYSVQ